MKDKISVLLVGRSKPGVDALEGMLEGQPGIELRVRRVDNGYVDPLYGIPSLPDVLVLDLSHVWEDELRALSLRQGAQRPPLIAIGPGGNTRIMRMAMQAGARDFYTHPVPAEELLTAIHRTGQKNTALKGSISAIINAKGGSGASFVACSLAQILAAEMQRRVALVDLDLQFGSLPVYLDLKPQNGLIEALAAVDHLDPVALEGYMSKHPSGLHLLASMSEQIALPWNLSGKSLNQILDMATVVYEDLYVDLPRQLDPLTTTVLQRADRVLVVMQQSLAHLHDTKRMLRVLKDELAIPNERLQVIVNRYQEKSAVSLTDIREALQPGALLLVPNDFKRVAEAVNVGASLLDTERNAAITKSFVKLAAKLSGEERAKSGSLRQAFAQFFGR